MRGKDQGRKTKDQGKRLSAFVLHPSSAVSKRHSVFALAPDLLLVFKPRGHREAPHAHPYPQRLRVLRGRLEVRTARGDTVVEAGGRALRIAAGREHATRARSDTWLIAEKLRAR